MATIPTQTDALPNGPLDKRAVPVCVDMPNLFAEETDSNTPRMEPGLKSAVQARRAETLVITCGETDICVPASVLGAFDRRDRIVLAADGVCSSSDETHDAMMTLYGQRFGRQLEVATVDRILHNWNLSELMER
ncbi:Isochorismatase family protein [Methylobacterium sp. ap11]|uniref:cysteine hydrolase family protein n=1 Tax=Methylobacterium sp. ap11 TaxID=1761799 RepID=UPI0008B69957|nr:isochorismatase family protein [Methylobacterium sp. ap11]SEP42852.1 Isochorismatase family protein [Methylobacterium sp. ap11]